MSAHTQLVIAINIATVFGLATFGFLAWLAWGLCWDLYDYVMQRRTRKRMHNLQPRSGRDCFRDMKGVTR